MFRDTETKFLRISHALGLLVEIAVGIAASHLFSPPPKKQKKQNKTKNQAQAGKDDQGWEIFSHPGVFEMALGHDQGCWELSFSDIRRLQASPMTKINNYVAEIILCRL